MRAGEDLGNTYLGVILRENDEVSVLFFSELGT